MGVLDGRRDEVAGVAEVEGGEGVGFVDER